MIKDMKLFEYRSEVSILVAAEDDNAAAEIAERAFSKIDGGDLFFDADSDEVDASKLDKDTPVEVAGPRGEGVDVQYGRNEALRDAIDLSTYAFPVAENRNLTKVAHGLSHVRLLEESLREMTDLAASEGYVGGRVERAKALLNTHVAIPLLTTVLIARICWEVNSAYCEAIGEKSLSWDESKASTIKGVEAYLADPSMTPERSHALWMKEKVDTGWRFGPIKDAVAKTHPCMVDYDQLPPQQRVKDDLFLAVLRSIPQ